MHVVTMHVGNDATLQILVILFSLGIDNADATISVVLLIA
jgi:hypothetical protein